MIKEYIKKARRSHVNDSFSRLTEREREILQMVAEGKTNKEISGYLHISTATVQVHRVHIMEKLDLHNTASLTRYAIKHGIVSLDL